MRVQHGGLKVNLCSWALPLCIGWDTTRNKKKDYVKYGVLIEFLCLSIYIGLCSYPNEKETKQS